MNNDVPCRVMADLRLEEARQDAAEARWEAERESRLWEAHEDLLDHEKLKLVLNDEELARPLSLLMQDLEADQDLKRSANRIREVLVELLLGD